jgi:hypothetical protein
VHKKRMEMAVYIQNGQICVTVGFLRILLVHKSYISYVLIIVNILIESILSPTYSLYISYIHIL